MYPVLHWKMNKMFFNIKKNECVIIDYIFFDIKKIYNRKLKILFKII
jgi:mRNA-degrading endonuclease HigB of HigAB toxin-antitoxin module